jgi:hypothetical protein
MARPAQKPLPFAGGEDEKEEAPSPTETQPVRSRRVVRPRPPLPPPRRAAVTRFLR